MEEIECYEAAFLADLVRDFDIPPEKSAQLGEAINRAANEWRRDDGLKAPWEAVDHVDYRRIYDNLVRLRDDLSMLDQEALRQLKDIQDFVEYGDESARIVDTSEADDEEGLAIRFGDIDDDMREDFSPARLARMVAATLDAVKYGTYTSPSKRGPKQDPRLERWVWNARSIWIAATKQPFTRDFTSANEPVSGAAFFCVRLYTVLSPETPASRINSTMKRVIAATR